MALDDFADTMLLSENIEVPSNRQDSTSVGRIDKSFIAESKQRGKDATKCF